MISQKTKGGRSAPRKRKESDKDSCARCGMEQARWSVQEGVEKEGQTYCCNGCAENSGCECSQPGASAAEQKGRGQTFMPKQEGEQTQSTGERPYGQRGDYEAPGGDYPSRHSGDQPGGQPPGGY